MRMTARQFGEAIVLNVHGSIVGPEANGLLQSTVRQRMEGGIRMVVLDLTHVEAIDDGGLRTLSAVADLMARASGCIRLAGVNDRMPRDTAIWLLRTFSTFETVEDAVGDVRRALESAASRRTQPGERLRLWFRQFRPFHRRDRAVSGGTEGPEPLRPPVLLSFDRRSENPGTASS
jgi:anti-anti-sigma regulatory factor